MVWLPSASAERYRACSISGTTATQTVSTSFHIDVLLVFGKPLVFFERRRRWAACFAIQQNWARSMNGSCDSIILKFHIVYRKDKCPSCSRRLCYGAPMNLKGTRSAAPLSTTIDSSATATLSRYESLHITYSFKARNDTTARAAVNTTSVRKGFEVRPVHYPTSSHLKPTTSQSLVTHAHRQISI